VVGPGDSVVVDPDTGDLIVKSDAADAFTLTRFAKAAGPPQLITIGDTNLRLASQPLSAGSIRKGRLVLTGRNRRLLVLVTGHPGSENRAYRDA
jgi:hypothetical protein